MTDDEARDPLGDSPAGPPPAPVQIPTSAPPFSLNKRDRALASELDRIDPQLTGLFRLGLELSSRDGIPGIGYLIAEAGRELNLGVVNALATGEPELSSHDLASVDDDDRYLRKVARALRLSPQHPLVHAWAEMHRRFNSEVHFVANRTTGSSAPSDFALLADLLRGRLSPYFDAQDDADALLSVEQPGSEHLDALRRILVRPALRTRFLRSLHNPRWLEPLISVGAFNTPPWRRVNDDGSWSLVSWLEGEYLARVAVADPDVVAALLHQVPTDNDNPAVWDTVARAASALPPARAATILPRVVLGLRSVPRVVLPDTLIALGRHVAPVAIESAMDLANTLLWLRRRPPSQPGEDEGDASNRLRFSTAWLLERVDLDDAQTVIEELVPAIVSVDPHGALTLLRDKLRAALVGIDREARTATSRETAYWCRDLGGTDDRDDVRAMFARALARTAIGVAGHSDDEANQVVSLVKTLPRGIGQRILYHLVSQCRPFLVSELNALISEPTILEWDMPGREVGEVLRGRFSDASLDAQQAFASVLETGPRQAELDHYREWAARVGRDDSPEAALAYWQRKHLRRFGSELPDVLRPLAERIGYVPEQPDIKELSLTEDGWFAGGASWGGERRPAEADRLSDLEVSEAARIVAQWVPDTGAEAPTLRGLEAALEELAAKDPTRGLELARALMGLENTPRGVSAVLHGVRSVQRDKRELPWELVEQALHEVLSRYPDAQATEWRAARRAAVDLIEDVLDDLPTNAGDGLLSDVQALLAHPTTWEEVAPEEIQTINGVLSASLNTLAGRATTALVRLSMRDYRDRRGPDRDDSERAISYRRVAGERLRMSIEGILLRDGRPGIAARASLGTFLPQLVWLDTDWWSRNAVGLIGDGITRPTANPIWSAYLTRGRFYDQTFVAVRQWYVAAAMAASPNAEGDDRTWAPERHLIEHVLIAVVRGLAQVGDRDQLVEQCVGNVPVEDLAHAYWSIFRGWSDAQSDGVLPEMVARLVGFWGWRVEQMEQEPSSPRRQAEADALLWFCLTPFLPASDVLRLGFRTLGMAGGRRAILHSLWERMSELASDDADAAFVMTERAVELELQGEFPHFVVNEFEGVFAAAFGRGSAATKSAALALLNRLGDAGFAEFGRLRPR